MPHNAEGSARTAAPTSSASRAEDLLRHHRKEKVQLSGWWERKRAADDAQFLYGVGAVPEKPKVTYAKPPEQVIGKAAREHMSATPSRWRTGAR